MRRLQMRRRRAYLSTVRKESYTLEDIRPARRWLSVSDHGDEPVVPIARPDKPLDAETPHPDILVVDDDAMLLDTLADFIDLRLPHARVTTCLSGAAALELTASTDFHAIITDLKMPNMDGITLLKEIRRRRPSTPVLIITGHGDHELRIKAEESGAFAFIQKPINRDLFMGLLEQALALRSSRGQGQA